jgi:hypothetical protein
MTAFQHQPAVTLTHDGMIVFLWKSGLDRLKKEVRAA